LAVSEASVVSRFHAFDLLATLVAVVNSQGAVLFANAALEDALGISRRAIVGSHFPDSFTETLPLLHALQGAGGNEFAALRYDAVLRRMSREDLPVHVIVTQTEKPEEIIVELLPLEQQAARTGKSGWPNRRRPTRNSSATWHTRSRTRWAAFAALPSCSKWRWSRPI
jgi:nitrogen-specific signal transduction histidine kinase